MKTISFLVALVISVGVSAQNYTDLPSVKFIDYQPENRGWFVKYGQFQLNFNWAPKNEAGLSFIDKPDKHIEKIERCLNIAKQNKINVLIFPEATMALSEEYKSKIVTIMEKFSKENDAIIIAGTFYDENQRCKNITILPTGTHYTYKIRPSIFESSPIKGQGMIHSDTLHVLRTKYGNILTLVCVDLISDDANYVARNLSNRGLIDVLVNINFNPKSQEFMREASAMVVRHPLFVSLTNVSRFQKSCTVDGDEFGNTSIFGSINNDFFSQEILETIPNCYKTADGTQIQPAYKSMLGIINPEVEGALLFDLNLRMIRTSMENNAPDQGYPSIRNIEVVPIE